MCITRAQNLNSRVSDSLRYMWRSRGAWSRTPDNSACGMFKSEWICAKLLKTTCCMSRPVHSGSVLSQQSLWFAWNFIRAHFEVILLKSSLSSSNNMDAFLACSSQYERTNSHNQWHNNISPTTQATVSNKQHYIFHHHGCFLPFSFLFPSFSTRMAYFNAAFNLWNNAKLLLKKPEEHA